MLWEGILSGEWSFIDDFDASGTRYLVARRNVVTPDFVQLTRTERRVTHRAALGLSMKVIAYAMDLSMSRVSQSLTLALRKLGLRNRGELITLCGDIVPSEEMLVLEEQTSETTLLPIQDVNRVA
jgi:DNA-binding CsgD family transcriptional regulator